MNRINQIHNQIAELQEELALIQSECNHPLSVLDVKTSTYNMNSDWDTLATPSYRVTKDYTCGLCEKQWTESEEYHR